MKSSLKTIASFLALCAWAVGAQAFVVFQDNFNYPNGPILTSAAPTWVPGYGNANSGQIQISGNQVVIPGTGTADQPRVYFTNGLSYTSLANYTNGGTIYISNATAAFFPSNSPIAAVYASFTATSPSSRFPDSVLPNPIATAAATLAAVTFATFFIRALTR